MSLTVDLSGHVALVTGASSGLGAHFAAVLARSGAKVAIGARRTDRLQQVADGIAAQGGRALAVKLDVTDAASIKSAVEHAQEELGPLDILVNNAGIAIVKPVLEQTREDWDQVIGTNLTGPWLVAQEVARQMVALKRPGSIVNIASVLGIRAPGQLSSYAAAKAGLIHLTHQLALDLARHHVRVNAIAPGYVATEMNADFLESAIGQAMLKRVPQRRFAALEDLDGPLLLLASDASAHMTGAVIVVDGGHTLAI